MKKYLINFFIQKGVGFSPSLMFADYCFGIQLYIPKHGDGPYSFITYHLWYKAGSLSHILIISWFLCVRF